MPLQVKRARHYVPAQLVQDQLTVAAHMERCHLACRRVIQPMNEARVLCRVVRIGGCRVRVAHTT